MGLQSDLLKVRCLQRSSKTRQECGVIATQEYSFAVTVRTKDDLPSLQTKEEVQAWVSLLLKNGKFLDVVSVRHEE